MTLKEKETGESLRLCKEGDFQELSRVFTEILPGLKSLLQTLGASTSEAESLAAEVLSDCLVGTLKRPPLIRQFQGRSSMATWMGAIARNRYYDFMRGQKMDRSLAVGLQDALEGNDQWIVNDVQDEHVFEALRQALTKAFQALSASDAVLLQLVHAHKVDQRVLARFLGWSDTKMSRHLSALRSGVKFHVYSSLRHTDNGEPPCWKDLMEVFGRLAEPI
jgi:RNA polymerase sigma factor (sigma-70 family)